MAELKPKQDNQLARDQVESDAKADTPRQSKATKPHGDKLKDAFESGKSSGASQTRH